MPALDATAVGARIRELRERAGLTQAQLAEAAGVSNETVSRIERSAFEPAFSTCIALANALGVSLDALARSRVAGDSRPIASPALRRLTQIAGTLPPRALDALVKIAALLPTQPPSGAKRRPSAD